MRKSFIFFQFIFLIFTSSFLFASFEGLQHSTITTLGSSSRFYFSDSSSDVVQQPNRLEGNFSLNSDLELNYDLEIGPNTVLYLNNHKIIGNGHSIILDSDFTVNAGETLYISGNATIEGRKGGNLVLGNRAQILVDGNSTVTLRNLVLKNTRNTIARPAAKCMEWHGKLALDNVTFDLTDDFYFYSGQMFIHNDVIFTGTSQFVYWGVRPSYINSTLHFDKGTTFDFHPSTTDKALIKMQKETSSIYFDGCTLKTTHTGMQLTKGRVYFDNKVTVTSAAENSQTTPSVVGSDAPTGTDPRSVSWSPDGRYFAVANYGSDTLQIFSFTGGIPSSVGSVGTQTGPTSVSWSSDGRYLAVVNYGSDTLQIFLFTGGNPSTVGSAVTGTQPRSVSWSPDGGYIAVVNYGSNTLQIFSFTGGNPSFVGSINTDNNPYSVSWSPDGRYIAVVNYVSNTLQIFSFTGGNPSSVGSVSVGTDQPDSVSWSPDGRYIAVVSYGTPYYLKIFLFTGGNPSFVGSINTNDNPYSVSWSPDGRYLAVANYGSDTLQIFSFTGGNPSPVGSTGAGSDPWSVAWSPDGKYIAVVNHGDDDLRIFQTNFRYEAPHQASTNSIVFSDVQNGVEPEASIFVLSGARIVLDGIIHL